MRENKRYTDEYKADVVAMLQRTDRSLRGVARDLGVNEWTLRDWYKRDQMAKKKKSGGTSSAAPSGESSEQRLERLERENERLRKENARLQEDREILKKAAAFFAKESE